MNRQHHRQLQVVEEERVAMVFAKEVKIAIHVQQTALAVPRQQDVVMAYVRLELGLEMARIVNHALKIAMAFKVDRKLIVGAVAMEAKTQSGVIILALPGVSCVPLTLLLIQRRSVAAIASVKETRIPLIVQSTVTGWLVRRLQLLRLEVGA